MYPYETPDAFPACCRVHLVQSPSNLPSAHARGELTRQGRIMSEVLWCFTKCGSQVQMGNCNSLKKNPNGYDSDDKIDFGDGNVNATTTKVGWDEMISEANKNGRLELSFSWDIQATPTSLLRDGQQMDKLVGANKLELRKKVVMFADSSSQCSEGS